MKKSTPISLAKNEPKVMHAWAIFDAANSAHALVIAAAVFPAYFLKVTNDKVSLMGFEWANSSLYAFSVSFSYFLVALISPMLSGIADYSQRRKSFLKLFTVIGGISCMMLYFFKGTDSIVVGVVFFILSMVGFGGGLVFYNAYLPDIATEDRMDWLSARGFAYGYAGSVILLIFILWMISHPERLGLADAAEASRVGFVLVGIWWIGLSQITFRVLPKDLKSGWKRSLWVMGFARVKQVWRALKVKQMARRFLISFFFYSMGVQTVLLLAATFGESEMEFGTEELIGLILVIQLVAMIGSYVFAWISSMTSNKTSILIQLVIWIGICVAAYFVVSKWHFYLLAFSVGLVFGGIQSLSRSTYAKMIEGERGRITSYFSFYEVLEKLSIVFGTLLFGLISEFSGSMRYGALFLSVLMLFGFLLMIRVPIKSSR